MAPSTLGHLILGYQLVWNRLRQPAAVQLFLTPHGQEPVEGAHFLRTLEQTWSEQCPPLLLTPQTAGLLTDLLNHGSRDGPQLVVQHDLMRNEAVTGAVQRAHARGARLRFDAEWLTAADREGVLEGLSPAPMRGTNNSQTPPRWRSRMG